MSRRFFVAAALLLLAIAPVGSRETAKQAQEKSPSQRAWDDVRWLMTAMEAYATDNDGLYAPASAPRAGDVSVLAGQLKWYYANTFPTRASAPETDPWGRPYQFVISKTGKLYALVSLGPDGKLEPAAANLLRRVKNDDISEKDLTERKSSKNLVVVSGNVVLAPPEVLQGLHADK